MIGASFNGMPTTPLLQPNGARFDPNKLIWLGSTNRETQVTYVWHTAPVQTLNDVKTKEIIMGAQAPGSTQYDYPVLANALFGFKFKVDHRLREHAEDSPRDGARRGARHHRQLVDAQGDQLELDRGEEDPDPRAVGAHEESRVPRRSDVPRSAKNDAERAALRLALARLEYGRPFFLPPNVPAARVEALRRAFDATMKDPAYLAEADKLKIEVDPLTGEQVAALVEQVSRTDPETVARVRTAMENK